MSLSIDHRRRRAIRRLAQRFQISENAMLLALAVVVGISTGAGIWLFQLSIEYAHEFFRVELAGHRLGYVGNWAMIPVLALVGAIVGTLVHFGVGEERHHGVAGVIESVALVGGRLRYQRIPPKAAAAALSIGGGASVGPEDPSVQIGANIGSFFGQQLHLSEDRVRLLVAAGAASAIAAAFNAPIAGVFFALEVVLGSFGTGSVGVVVLSAVMSSVFTQSVAHTGPELGIRSYALGGASQVPFYILLGAVAAPVAAAFIRAVFWQNRLWHGWALPAPIKTALAGAIVGGVGVYFPEIWGAGRETMNEVLNTGGGEFTIQLLVGLVLAKIMMTSLSMGGGFMGGIFAPSLFVGAMLGGAYGRLINRAFPTLDIGDPAAYAIAGMAAMMAGVVRAPITAILLPFELTNNYQLILPIMLATVVTVFMTERLERDGIYTKALRMAGVNIQQGRDVDVMQSVMVREVMRTPPPIIKPQATLIEIRDALRQHQSKALCVVKDRHNKQTLLGIVTLSDLQTAYETARAAAAKLELVAEDICSHDVVTVTPNEPVLIAIQRMGQHGFGHIPVVSAEDDDVLLGLLTRDDVMRSYNIAMTRKWETQFDQNQIRLKNLVDEEIIAIEVPSNAHIAGKPLKEIHLPKGVIVVSIRRHGKVIHPGGDTTIKSGDKLTVVVPPEHKNRAEAIITAPSLESMRLEI